MKQWELVGHIADLKDADCQQSLALETLVELLVEKGVFTRQEFARKAQALDLIAGFACRRPRTEESVLRKPETAGLS